MAQQNVQRAGAAPATREDLDNLFKKLTFDNQPALNKIRMGMKATNVYHEWSTLEINTTDDNPDTREGVDIVPEASDLGERLGNYTEIFRTAKRVSHSAKETKVPGVINDVDVQLTFGIIRRMQQMEKAVFSRTPSQAQAGGATPSAGRRLGGLPSWITTNAYHGAGGSGQGFANRVTRAVTGGTKRALTETMFRDAIQAAYSRGANANLAVCSLTQQRVLSSFVANNTRFQTITNSGGAKLNTKVESYTSANGPEVFIIGTPHMKVYAGRGGTLSADPVTDLVLVDGMYVEKNYLQQWKKYPLAKTGDSDNTACDAEMTISVRNEAALSCIFDLQETGNTTA